jgi:hypothetical protein
LALVEIDLHALRWNQDRPEEPSGGDVRVVGVNLIGRGNLPLEDIQSDEAERAVVTLATEPSRSPSSDDARTRRAVRVRPGSRSRGSAAMLRVAAPAALPCRERLSLLHSGRATRPDRSCGVWSLSSGGRSAPPDSMQCAARCHRRSARTMLIGRFASVRAHGLAD